MSNEEVVKVANGLIRDANIKTAMSIGTSAIKGLFWSIIPISIFNISTIHELGFMGFLNTNFIILSIIFTLVFFGIILTKILQTLNLLSVTQNLFSTTQLIVNEELLKAKEEKEKENVN